MPVQQLQHYHGALITPSDTESLQQSLNTSNRSSCLYVGVGGNVHILTVGGDNVTFTGIPSGTFIPVHTSWVFATGTTASYIIAVDMVAGSSDDCYSTDVWQNINIFWQDWNTHWNDCLP
jgi:hypothetical protein